MTKWYEELRTRSMKPSPARARSEAGKARDAASADAQARYDLVRKRKGGRLLPAKDGYVGKHRKDPKSK